MSADAHAIEPAGAATAAPAWRSRRWAIAGTLSVTETVSWGILYYAFAAFLLPMQASLGAGTAQLAGAFSTGLLVSALAGVAVGRHLDRHGPRTLMTAGSAAGAALVLAWSQVESLAALYAVWAGIGVVMAAVLYEPAFTVLAKQFPHAGERRRAMTLMTLVAALASFVFLPLSQALIERLGWRDALVVLALVLAAVTVPLHAAVLRAPATPSPAAVARDRSVAARDALRSRPFWLLTAAFFLASVATIAMTVHAIPFLVERGHSPAFAAFAVGLVGVSQIPGRLLFGPLAARLPRGWSTAAVFGLVAAGIAAVVAAAATWAVVAGLVLLGMGNGMATLARATAIADVYGARAYGTIASVAGALTTAARAAGPVTAAVYAAAFGYPALLWTLAALAAVAAVLGHRAARAPRAVGGTTALAAVRAADAATVAAVPREELPRFVEPMLARPGRAPAAAGWSLELKLDGCRGQLRVDRGRWTLRSRPGRSCGDGFAELAALAELLSRRRVLLDGELVCLGDDGKPDFHALRPRMLGHDGPAAVFAAFDLLHLDGRSTRRLPLARRRELLRELLPADGESWCVVSPLEGAAEDVVRVVAEAQLEGVVAKRLDAPYEPGARSGAWLKHKLRRSATFAVSGWAPARDREPEAVYLAHVDAAGTRRPAGVAAFGLTREERELIRERARPPRAGRAVHDVEDGLRVEVEFHGPAGRPLRDAVMRRLVT